MVWCDRVGALTSADKGCHTYAKCCIINTECGDVILSGYYVINIVDVMSQITGCEVMHIVAVISSIGWVL